MLLILACLSGFAGPVAGETPTVRTELPLPDGVTSSPVAREMALKPRSAAVKFSIDGKPEIRDGQLVVRGVLVNEGSKPAVVHVVSAPHTGGPFLLVPRGATFQPPPDRGVMPEVSPSPQELTLPAGARVPYESALRLGSWRFPEGGAEIDWSFQFWTDPVKGTLPGRLAPPG